MKHIKLFESFLNEETFKGKRGLSLNIQHDCLTLKMPTGNFTYNRSGTKASGQFAHMKGAFDALNKYVQTEGKNKTNAEVFKDLLNPDLMDKLVPGWDKPSAIDKSVGDNADRYDRLRSFFMVESVGVEKHTIKKVE